MHNFLKPSPEASRQGTQQPLIKKQAVFSLHLLTVLHHSYTFYYFILLIKIRKFEKEKRRSYILTLASAGSHNLYSIWFLLGSFVYLFVLTTLGSRRKDCGRDEIMEIYLAIRGKN